MLDSSFTSWLVWLNHCLSVTLPSSEGGWKLGILILLIRYSDLWWYLLQPKLLAFWGPEGFDLHYTASDHFFPSHYYVLSWRLNHSWNSVVRAFGQVFWGKIKIITFLNIEEFNLLVGEEELAPCDFIETLQVCQKK